MAESGPTIHATALLVGARGVLIRGPSGSGKSLLALRLLQSCDVPGRFARLIGDDRVHLDERNGRLLVRPAALLAGLLEIRGLGIRSCGFEPVAVLSLVIDLGSPEASRMPSQAVVETEISGVRLPRLAVAAGSDPLPLVLAVCGLAGPQIPVSEPETGP